MNITDFSNHKQSYLDLNISIPFEVTDHEAALMLLLQNLDYSFFNKTKKKSGRPPAVDTYSMMLIILYARTQGRYSSRQIEQLCKRDLFLIKILDGRKAPDHTTIDRFIRNNREAIDNLFFQTIQRLDKLNELKKDVIYQDGTKMESKAGRFTFVWKKATQRNLIKLEKNIEELISESELYLSLEFKTNSPRIALEKIIIKLKESEEDLIPEKAGRGHRVTKPQKLYRDCNIYLEKLKLYGEYLDSMKTRNSMSKTDPDATFMRMKDDYMRNGQLKPAYNLQVLVDSSYIVGTYASDDRTDYATMIPAIDNLHSNLPWKYSKYCADSGYDCQQNYEALEQRGIEPYIKTQSYEQSKRRSYKKDIGRKENMSYSKEEDCFICKRGKKLKFKYISKKKNQYGFETQTHVYQCLRGCKSCSLKSSCMKKSKAQYKRVQINHSLAEYQRISRENITSTKGQEIRVNRSIQAEGAFAQVKNNMSFRRFLHKGMKGIHTEWQLIALAANIIHLGYRIASGKIGIPFHYQLEEKSA